MRILPVLDLMDGQVVRGIGGRRSEYRPIKSKIAASSQPCDVAMAFREHLGLTELYVADLNAIAGAPPALADYAELGAIGFRLWIDSGIKDLAQAGNLADAAGHGLVIGLETMAGPRVLRELIREFGSPQIMFSLDLKEGVPMGHLGAWTTPTAWAIAEQAIQEGIDKLIVLDLARVGENRGTGNENLCAQLAMKYPNLEVLAGGGIRHAADLRRLHECGVKGVLLASALHDGHLTRQDLEGL